MIYVAVFLSLSYFTYYLKKYINIYFLSPFIAFIILFITLSDLNISFSEKMDTISQKLQINLLSEIIQNHINILFIAYLFLFIIFIYILVIIVISFINMIYIFITYLISDIEDDSLIETIHEIKQETDINFIDLENHDKIVLLYLLHHKIVKFDWGDIW